MTEHSTPREALLVVLHGTAEVAIDGTPHTLASGEAIYLPAAVPHSVYAPEAMRMLLVTLAA
ncbi:cupin domain-containing protein [Rubricoccus marinus]|uniref:cupin domain-containing protein n=1 Tax=Rubricoccus marinus TaxID=716817 RepID=UPI001C5319B4|nr:cupin domain-containing protein [Rubricoccus marinus]